MSSHVIKNRYEFVYLFDVENGNPNGDPDAGNMPRIDPETNHGIVTDVCLKRKIRNYVYLAKGNKSPYRIYVQEMAVLNQFHKEAYNDIGYDWDKMGEKERPKSGSTKGEKVEAARDWMCRNFFDVRAFGAVMATEVPAGIVRGPVQLNFARSVEPVVPMEVTITRVAVTKESDAIEKEREIGRKHIIPYGLYRAEGYISANLAQKTGFSEDDLNIFWEALLNMFEHDRSATRGKMCARKLVVFKHDSHLGNAPAHKLFDRVRVKPKDRPKGMPARAFENYEITINKNDLPRGVELIEKI